MTKKKLIPDVSDLLDMLDEKMKFSIGEPGKAKEKAMQTIRTHEEQIRESMFRDFMTLTLGDYINAAQTFNREMFGTKVDATQEAAFFTLFAFEERSKRISDHYQHIN